jgi:hypothetical protein
MDSPDHDAASSDPEPSPEVLAFIRQSLANDTDGSVKTFLERPLDDVLLVLACGTTRRIEGLCRALFGGPYLSARIQGDEYLYQHLRTTLISQLSDDEDLVRAKTIAVTELPATLPYEPGSMYDMDWTYQIEPTCRKLEAEVMRVAVAKGVNPYDDGADIFFDTVVKSIACVKEIMADAHRQFAAKHGLPAPGERSRPWPDSAPALGVPLSEERPRRRQGRTPVRLAYEVAQRVWWELADDVAPGKPNQQEFCDRLTALGYPMSPRTLRDRIAVWRRDGLVWDRLRGCILRPGAIVFAKVPERRRTGRSARDTYQTPRSRKLCPQEEQAIRDAADLRTLRDLAAEFGVSHETVRAIARETKSNAASA